MELFEFLYDRITGNLVVPVAIPLLTALAVAIRWDIGLTSSTLGVGKRIGDHLGGRGMQDAVTPRWQWKLTVFLWSLAVVVLATAFFRFGWLIGAILTVWFFAVGVAAGLTFMPRAESRHYLRIICNSLISRVADHRRDGDALRADAAHSVLQEILQVYGADTFVGK